MSESEKASIEAKLDIIIRLLAVSISPETLSLAERAHRLNLAGISPKEIASIFGTTRNTVNVALSNKRKKARKR